MKGLVDDDPCLGQVEPPRIQGDPDFGDPLVDEMGKLQL
jgi:hypothetical protein